MKLPACLPTYLPTYIPFFLTHTTTLSSPIPRHCCGRSTQGIAVAVALQAKGSRVAVVTV